jgi:hypothetical protein
MSYILQVFDLPAIDSSVLALRACSRVRPASPDTQRKVAAFIAAVYRHLPDDGADSVWPEGLPGTPGDDAPLNLAIDVARIDPAALATIAHVAVDAGLQVFDPQAGTLFRCDRHSVDDDGNVTPFAECLPQRAVTATSGFDARDGDLSLAVVAQQLLTVLEPFGFAVTPAPTFEHAKALWLERDFGPTRQQIVLQVQPERSFQYVSWWMRWWVPAARAHWQQLLQPRFGERAAHALPPYPPDIEFQQHDLLGAHALRPRYPALFEGKVRDRAQVEAYASELAGAMSSVVHRTFQHPKDWEFTAGLMLGANRISPLLLSAKGAGCGLFHLGEQLTLLTLALSAAHPLREVWIETLRYRQHTTQRRHWQQHLGVDGDEAFEALIAALRTQPMPMRNL